MSFEVDLVLMETVNFGRNPGPADLQLRNVGHVAWAMLSLIYCVYNGVNNILLLSL